MVRHTGEYFIDEEGVAVTSVLALQAAGINRSEFYTPETDCFTAHGNASFGREVLDITMTQVKSVVEPNGIGNDIRWGALNRNLCRLYVLITRLSHFGELTRRYQIELFIYQCRKEI